MKILIATTFFPPEGQAGTEVYTQTIAGELHRCGHEVEIVCVTGWVSGQEYWNGVQEEISDGIHVYRLALNWQKSRAPNDYLFDNPMVFDWLVQRLCESQPDVVHVTSCLTLSASIVRAARAAGIPIIITLTDFWFICPRHTLLRHDQQLCDGRTSNHECLMCLTHEAKVFRWPNRLVPETFVLAALDKISRHPSLTAMRGMRGIVLDMDRRRKVLRAALRMADVVISPSRFLAETYAGTGADIPIDVVPHGHDLGWLTEGNGRANHDLIRFATLSHPSEIKGIHVAIEAFRGLPAESQAELWIYGRIDEEEQYGRRLIAAASGLTHVSFCGAYRHCDLGAVMSQLDVIIVPSLWYENAPLIIQEAFAAGKPVVASNLGGMAEAIRHGVDGLLFDAGSADSLQRELMRLIGSPALLEQLKQGIPPIRAVSDEVAQLLSIYENTRKKDSSRYNETERASQEGFHG